MQQDPIVTQRRELSQKGKAKTNSEGEAHQVQPLVVVCEAAISGVIEPEHYTMPVADVIGNGRHMFAQLTCHTKNCTRLKGVLKHTHPPSTSTPPTLSLTCTQTQVQAQSQKQRKNAHIARHTYTHHDTCIQTLSNV